MRTRRFALATLTVAALLCSNAVAQTYRWKDASGNVHYTDTPPPTSAKEYRTVSPPEPNAPRDPRTLPRRELPTVATQPTVSAPVRPVEPPAAAPVDVQKQLEENRRNLRAQQNEQARKERASRDAKQCSEWHKSLDRIDQAEKETGQRKRTAAELKDLAQARSELERNIAAQCD